MGRKQEKGKKGNAPKYITRNQALTRLQIKLPEFRRLCILKGVHPREPRKKTQGSHKTYYHIKDIDFLAHEPLLAVSRQIKAHAKKVRRARMRNEEAAALRLEAMKPVYSLDHLVKERYPAFVDALRDLDDALTLVNLFAVLPAEKSLGIPSHRIHTSRRLSLEWQAYVTRTHSLRKVFVSVKGIYFQAEVVGQSITWIVPHALSQVIPSDVDFRVMVTFLEFYQTLLSFVLFKLYHELGLEYPPVLDPRLEAAAAELYDIMRLLAQNKSRPKEDVEAPASNDLTAEAEGNTPGPGGSEEGAEGGEEESRGSGGVEGVREEEAAVRMAALQQRLMAAAGPASQGAAPAREGAGAEVEGGDGAAGKEEPEEDEDEETRQCRELFKGLVFFLGREVPREPLLFLIRSFGGTASWDGAEAPLAEVDPTITHQVVDRPKQQKRIFSRSYVQPQWVFDSVNARLLLPTEPYVPGVVPPPHLSPFVHHAEGEEGYKPDYALVIERLRASAAEQQRKRAAAQADGSKAVGDMVLMLDGAEEEVAAQAQMQALAQARSEGQAEAARLAEAEGRERRFAEELAQEVAGVPFSAAAAAEQREESAGDGEGDAGEVQGEPDAEGPADQMEGDGVVEQPLVVDEEAEAKEMARLMMPRKKQKLYEAMQIGNARKRASVAQIMERKKLQLAKKGTKKSNKQSH